MGIGVSDNVGAALSNIALASGAFTYPAGMTNSALAPSNGCGGTLVASSGSNTLSLSGGAAPSGFCAIYVWVVTTGPGTYNATIPMGAVTTDQGPSIVPWNASLLVTPSVVVTTTADSGPGSLRAAIDFVNLNCTGPYAITFNIAGAGPHVIPVASSLPAVTCNNTIIDGYSQSGALPNSSDPGSNSAAIKIELSAACTGCAGLSLQAASTVKGLAIHGFDLGNIASSSSTQIHGNFIGTDASGNVAASNIGPGIHVTGGIAQIGMAGDKATANLISNNLKGIFVEGTANIGENTIGGRADGAAGNGNFFGIYVGAGGGTVRIDGNSIRHNLSSGIAVAADATASVVMSRNSSALNGGPGIDLNNDGVSINDDSTDADGGANGTLNTPIITQVIHSAGNTVVSGYLRSNASFPYLEFFSNAAIRPGITEGGTYVDGGSVVLGTGESFTFTLNGLHDNVSATASSCPDGCFYTSEYSQSVAAVPLGPAITLDKSSLSFAALAGTASALQTVTLTNTGNQPLTFGATPFTFAAPFTLAHSCPLPPATLAVGFNCQVTVGFNAPATPGTTPGSVQINSDAIAAAGITLSGFSSDPPQVSISTQAAPVAGSVAPVSIVLANITAGGPAFTGLSGSITLPAGYTFDTGSGFSSTCGASASGTAAAMSASGGAVPASGSCTLATGSAFAPSTPGSYTFTIPAGAIMITAPFTWSNPSSITFTATVTAPTLTLTPTTLSFGSQDIGTPSAPQTVTLTNPGSVPVDIASIAASGDFASQTACPKSLPKGASCTVDVKFLPTTAGPRNGALVIDASGVTYSVTLGGTGTVPLAPTISVAPGSLGFANRTLGTVSPAQAVTITNSGTAPLLIALIAVSGDFGFTSACPAALAVGASCSLAVKFTPLVVGNRTGNLTISTNAPGSPTVVALSGVGVDVPVGTLDVSPQSLDFGAHPVGATTPPQLLVVTNVGSATVFILDLGLSGDFAFGDTPTTDRACGGPLPAGERCVLALVFRPTAGGGRIGNLHIRSDGTNFASDVGLSGFGVAVAPQRALEVPATLTFGPQPFGTRSNGIALALVNRSSAPVSVSDIDAGGDFSVSESCTVIPAGGTCVATVFFSPTARGARSGTLTIRIQSETQPYLVALSGEGAANPVPILSLTPTRIGFGNTFVGSVSDTASVTLSNQGEAPLLLDAITPPGDFLIEDHCGAVLAAGASCTVDVRFFPRMLDVRGGSLEVRSNAAGSPHFVALSGTGCSIPNVGRSRIPQLLCGP